VNTSHFTDYYDDIHYQLNFDKDGSISGSSVYETHSACFIEGEWNKSKVRWTEFYHTGFSICVQRDLDPESQIIGTYSNVANKRLHGVVQLKKCNNQVDLVLNSTKKDFG
jgi:hypothetical protein